MIKEDRGRKCWHSAFNLGNMPEIPAAVTVNRANQKYLIRFDNRNE